jgi:hypothetical protein
LPQPHRRRTQRALCLLIAALAIGPFAWADGQEHGPRVPVLPKYGQECGACHIAYPPGMLPGPSWRRLLNNLPRHFGTDASLDPATTKELSDWLAAHAGTYRRAREEPPEDRITRSAWFVRKHDEVSAAAWKLPAVKSAANCAACHPQSDKGDFNERSIRIPR